MSRKPIPKRLPAIFDGSEDLSEIASYLIKRAGGVQAARDCITRANRAQKKPQGRPPRGDIYSLLIADAIQRHEQCTKWKALRQAAQMAAKPDDPAENVLRRLQDKLKKLKYETLAQLAQDCRLQVTRVATREGDLAWRMDRLPGGHRRPGGRIRDQIEYRLSWRD
jgi:hypothetical protein